jgi:DNA-binding response OmpR family regulator
MTRNSSILIVDDDPDIRDVFQFVLEAAGYHVNVASDGLDAWRKLNTRPALILLDLMMPIMDGEQFLKKLRSSKYARVPVVIVSGDYAAKSKTNEIQANGCLMKPVEFDELLNTVRRFVPVAEKRSDAA